MASYAVGQTFSNRRIPMPVTPRPTLLLFAFSLLVTTSIAGCRTAVDGGPITQLTLTPQEAVEAQGPPTVVRLLVRFETGGLELVAAEARRGTMLDVDLDAARARALDGEVAIVRYTTHGAAGLQLASGYFVAPVVGVAEFLDPDERHRIRRQLEHQVEPVVRVTLPYGAGLQSVALEPLVPDAEQPVEKWAGAAEDRIVFDLDLDEPEPPDYRQENDRAEP